MPDQAMGYLQNLRDSLTNSLKFQQNGTQRLINQESVQKYIKIDPSKKANISYFIKKFQGI